MLKHETGKTDFLKFLSGMTKNAANYSASFVSYNTFFDGFSIFMFLFCFFFTFPIFLMSQVQLRLK